MERVIFRHISGSKANQVEEFPLAQFVEAVVGRDPGSTVKYDPARDDLVGRQHARIARDPASPYHFTITDLNSRNGTFVNKQRIVGTTTLSPARSKIGTISPRTDRRPWTNAIVSRGYRHQARTVQAVADA